MSRQAVLRPGSIVLAVAGTALLMAGLVAPGLAVAVLAVAAAWVPSARRQADESAE
mgnify:FL=1